MKTIKIVITKNYLLTFDCVDFFVDKIGKAYYHRIKFADSQAATKFRDSLVDTSSSQWNENISIKLDANKCLQTIKSERKYISEYFKWKGTIFQY